jgi:hypothetical protein
MIDVAGARVAIAQAVQSAGLECAPYAPDAPVPPCGFVDDVEAAFLDSFCGAAQAEFQLVLVEQRNDRAEGLANLEAVLPSVLQQLTVVPGIYVTFLKTGTTQIGGLEMPAVSITVRADL